MKKGNAEYTKYMEIQRIVALNLVKARGEMSRKELADKAKVSYQHIYEIEEELKKPSLKVLERVASALNVQLHTLLKEDGAEALEVKSEPVSIFAKKLMRIPDDVYSLAQEVDLDDKIAWEDVRSALRAGQARAEEKRKVKKG